MTEAYIRDFVGYGANPPDPQWPNNARIAVQFVVNYEEGGEHNILDGDPHSEVFLLETPGANRLTEPETSTRNPCLNTAAVPGSGA